MSEFPVGTNVVIRPEYVKTSHTGQTYVVVKVNPRTLGLKNTATGATMKADPLCVMLPPVPGSTVDIIESVPLDEVFYMGQVVEAVGVRGLPEHGLLVVLGDTPRGYRLAALGGNDGRYFTGVPARKLTLVALADIPFRLAGSV